MLIYTSGRRRVLLPHRLLGPVIDQMRALAELCDALGEHLQDERWREAGAALWGAVAALHRRA